MSDAIERCERIGCSRSISGQCFDCGNYYCPEHIDEHRCAEAIETLSDIDEDR